MVAKWPDGLQYDDMVLVTRLERVVSANREEVRTHGDVYTADDPSLIGILPMEVDF